jgi:CRISPR-associated protein Cas2
MYCIAFYDVNEKRVAKILKIFRQYLHWIQKSVFEGYISEYFLQELMDKILRVIHPDQDSVILFVMQSDKYINKIYLGLEKEDKTSNII